MPQTKSASLLRATCIAQTDSRPRVKTRLYIIRVSEDNAWLAGTVRFIAFIDREHPEPNGRHLWPNPHTLSVAYQTTCSVYSLDNIFDIHSSSCWLSSYNHQWDSNWWHSRCWHAGIFVEGFWFINYYFFDMLIQGLECLILVRYLNSSANWYLIFLWSWIWLHNEQTITVVLQITVLEFTFQIALA